MRILSHEAPEGGYSDESGQVGGDRTKLGTEDILQNMKMVQSMRGVTGLRHGV